MLKKICKYLILIVIIIIVVIVLVVQNYDSEKFFDATLMQILTFVLTAIISFFFVQLLTDRRRKIDGYEHIIASIQTTIENREAIFSVRTKEALTLQRSVANKINYLNKHSFKSISKDLIYIKDEFEKIRVLYAENNQTQEKLSSVEEVMMNHIANISDKCDKIRLELYDI